MATFPLTNFPRVPQVERLTLMRRQAAMQSPWTLAQQTVNTAAQWQLEFSWPRMSHRNAEICAAWLDSLEGQIGTFLYRPRQSQTSSLTGRTLASTGFAYVRSMSVSGWSFNAASNLRLGQFFQIGSQLLRIISAPTNASASGTCLISFEPELRMDFSAGTPLIFNDPVGKFRLTTSEGIGFSLDPDRVVDFGNIAAREAVETE